ncbi:sialate O-acetylesterase [Paenibacillus cymbidii]|uniref:sialate O-acetylesterase n=1 Tax=Paenibacillus cymbidii TaxID=1639034 RepID=UPI0014369CE6|nr:sialate O-acetylesterase [Paenibacillus cymbidii]
MEAAGEAVVYRDVWFGDVWLAGGQSNMEWPLWRSADAEAALAQADMPGIRYYDMPKIACEGGETRGSESWKVCEPKQAKHFSAVAYYFARRLYEELAVPIGIIGCNWGGTSASCWVSENVLASDPELQVYIDEFREKVLRFDEAAFRIEDAIHQAKVADYVRKLEAGLTGAALGSYPSPTPFSPRTFQRPYGLYGTMLLKAVPYALRGFLFYQGESDANRPITYEKLLKGLIGNWRSLWNDACLPFLFVQLPAYGMQGNESGTEWPLLRESQAKVADEVANAGMVVALDCGVRDDIHPIDKKPVGQRLAHLALETVYGRDTKGTAPVCRELRMENEAAIVRFEHADNGLQADGDELCGFEIADASLQFVPAEASLCGDSVVVRSERVKQPAAVRYAWANFPQANLQSAAGLPARPFRLHLDGSRNRTDW